MTNDEMSKRIEAWGKLGSAALIAILFAVYIWVTHDAHKDFNEKMSKSIQRQSEAIERGSKALQRLAEDAAKD